MPRCFRSACIFFALCLMQACVQLPGAPAHKISAQSEELTIVGPLRMRIERAGWTNDSRLLIDVVMTNHGKVPQMGSSPIVFELQSVGGATYKPDAASSNAYAFSMMGTNLGSPVKPGDSATASLTFYVPRARYELRALRGTTWSGANFNTTLLGAWDLASIDGQ